LAIPSSRNQTRENRGEKTHLKGESEGGAMRGGEAGEGGVCERRMK